jgi:putative tryptophan/tyrosine transport system substrate-binding protein
MNGIGVRKTPDRRSGLTQRLLLLFALVCLQDSAVGAEDMAVFYPIVREPFSLVYSDLLAGLTKEYPGEITAYSIEGESSDLAANPINVAEKIVVALGNKSLEAVGNQDLGKAVFAALTQLDPRRKLAGAIILKPGAETYLSLLMEIQPSVGAVHVVYDPQRHGELIEDATDYLSRHGKKLNPVAVSNIRESAKGLRRIVREARPGDAIWLIPDSGLLDASMLDVVLDAAWDKRLAVFSANPSFVKRGALFAIYPDNVAIGQRLARMVLDVSQGKLPRGRVEYIKDVKVALNERTANHIGIRLTPEVKKSIDVVLPKL